MKRLLMFCLIIVLLGVLGYVTVKQSPAQVKEVLSKQQMAHIPTEVNGIPSIWHIYRSDTNGFVMRHPVDVMVQATPEGDRFYKLGDTQSMGTELYDGISLVITSGRMQGKNLKEFVESMQLAEKSKPTTTNISSVKPVAIAGKQGYTYHLSSLGEKDILYLPKSQNEYLQVINSTIEPPNQKRDFKEIVQKMLSSIEYTKEPIQPIVEQ